MDFEQIWYHIRYHIRQSGDIHQDFDDIMLDITLYDRNGKLIGRESTAYDGPKDYEPCCYPYDWVPINKPNFPIEYFIRVEDLLSSGRVIPLER